MPDANQTDPRPACLVITPAGHIGTSLGAETNCRLTLGVLVELFASARHRIVIAAPFMQSGFGLSGGILREAFIEALGRGVRVEIASCPQGLASLSLCSISRKPRSLVTCYSPAVPPAAGTQLGSHAKFCVTDGESAYVGSANLTGPGLGEQIEIGVLVHGAVAAQLQAFWRYAVETGLYVVAPTEGHAS